MLVTEVHQRLVKLAGGLKALFAMLRHGFSDDFNHLKRQLPRFGVRTRHTGKQLRAMILGGEVDLLLVREWLIYDPQAAVNADRAATDPADR